MELGGQRQVGDLLVVLIPEPARQAVHQSHRPSCEFVAGCSRDQDIEALVQPHESDIVGLRGCRQHRLRNFGEFLALVRRRTFGGETCHQAFQFTPDFQKPQLQPQIDLGDHDSAPRHDHDKPVARKALQRFTDRRPADLQAYRKRLLGQHRSR